MSFVSGIPEGVLSRQRSSNPQRLPEADVAIAAHSYMAPWVSEEPVYPVVDFHNLEWQHLDDLAKQKTGPRRAYLRYQSRLMRRFEKKCLKVAGLATFATTTEREWAVNQAPDCPALVLPNVLPSATAAEANLIWTRRSERVEKQRFIYLGKLTYPANEIALLQFLETTWEPIAKSLGLELQIIGACTEKTRRRLERFPGARVLGFVEDVTELLESAAAALFPMQSRAGSSLRILLFSLSGVPIIGSQQAFRGFPAGVGIAVETPGGWTKAITEVANGQRNGYVPRGREVAERVQNNEDPWDRFAEHLYRAAHQV